MAKGEATPALQVQELKLLVCLVTDASNLLMACQLLQAGPQIAAHHPTMGDKAERTTVNQ